MNPSPRKKFYKSKPNTRRYNNSFNNYNTSKIVKNNKRIRDSYVNAMSGFGGSYDPITRLSYNTSTVLDRATIETLYRQDWLSRKIIDTIPDDCTRKWINIHIQEEEILSDLQEQMKKLDVVIKFKEALINARLYGGSVILLGIPGSPRKPLDYNEIDELLYLNVLDKNSIDVLSYYKDPFKPNYGKPEMYKLNTSLRPDNYNASDYYIHESRLIRFDGAYLPEFTRRINRGWSDSVLNSINQTLKHYGTSIQSGALLFQDFISKILKMPNLADLLQSEDGRATLELRLQYAIANFSSLGIVLLGENEEFNKIQTPINGLPELIDKYIEIMAAASNIPRTRLFGQSLGTLAGATETTRAYYDYVSAYQTDNLEEPLTILIKIILSSKQSKTKGKVPEKWSFKFNSLWDATDKEVTTARKMQAQTDDIYIKNETATPEEIGRSRFRADGYSFDTVIDFDKRKGKFYSGGNKGIIEKSLNEQDKIKKEKENDIPNNSNLIKNKEE